MKITEELTLEGFTKITQHMGNVIGNFTKHYVEMEPKKEMEEAVFEVKVDDLKNMLKVLKIEDDKITPLNDALLPLYGFVAVDEDKMAPNKEVVLNILMEGDNAFVVDDDVAKGEQWNLLLEGYQTFAVRMYNMVFRSAKDSPRLEHLNFMRAQDKAGNYTPSMIGKPAKTFIPWNQMDLGQWVDDMNEDIFTTAKIGTKDEVYGVTFTYLPDLEVN